MRPAHQASLLSRGSQVRVLPGALLLRNSAHSPSATFVGEHKSKKVTGLASSRHNRRVSRRAISRTIRTTLNSQARNPSRKLIVTSGHERRRSLDELNGALHRPDVNELRTLRYAAGLS